MKQTTVSLQPGETTYPQAQGKPSLLKQVPHAKGAALIGCVLHRTLGVLQETHTFLSIERVDASFDGSLSPSSGASFDGFLQRRLSHPKLHEPTVASLAEGSHRHSEPDVARTALHRSRALTRSLRRDATVRKSSSPAPRMNRSCWSRWQTTSHCAKRRIYSGPPPTLGGCSTQSRTSKGLEPQHHDLIED